MDCFQAHGDCLILVPPPRPHSWFQNGPLLGATSPWGLQPASLCPWSVTSIVDWGGHSSCFHCALDMLTSLLGTGQGRYQPGPVHAEQDALWDTMVAVARPLVAYGKGRAGEAAASGSHLHPSATLATPDLRGVEDQTDRTAKLPPLGTTSLWGRQGYEMAHPALWSGDGWWWVVGEVTPSRWVERAEGVVPCGVRPRAVRDSPVPVRTAMARAWARLPWRSWAGVCLACSCVCGEGGRI